MGNKKKIEGAKETRGNTKRRAGPLGLVREAQGLKAGECQSRGTGSSRGEILRVSTQSPLCKIYGAAINFSC